MTHNGLLAAGFCAMTALGLMGYGCSSGDSSNTGGALDAGQGGNDATQEATSDGGRDSTADGNPSSADGGGRDGTAEGGPGANDGGREGGEGSAPDSGEAGLPACNPAPVDMSACDGGPACAETCGVDISFLTTSRPQRACMCSVSADSGTRWSCPSTAGTCVYPTDVDLTCLHLPTPLPTCPLDTPDGGPVEAGSADGGSNLIRTGSSSCTLPNSEVCGGVCGSATPSVFSYQNAAGAAKVGYCVCIAGVWECAGANDWTTL